MKTLFIIVASVFLAFNLDAASVQHPADLRNAIEHAHVFKNPMLWCAEGEPETREMSELWQVVVDIDAGRVDLPGGFERFMAAHPGSGWQPSVIAGLAGYYRQTGRYSKALEYWKKCWEENGAAENGNRKMVADYALAPFVTLLTSLGRVEELTAIYKAAGDRTLQPLQLNGTFVAMREAFNAMAASPGQSYRCGTYAITFASKAMGIAPEQLKTIYNKESPVGGFKLCELMDLITDSKLPLTVARRVSGTNLVIPSVVHWSANHYAALTEVVNGKVKVIDPTFGGARHLTAEAINAEASGYFIIPSSQVSSPSWRVVDSEEAAHIHGKGAINWIDDNYDLPQPPEKCGRQLDGRGIVDWWVTEPYLNLWMLSTPVKYLLSSGRDFECKLYYKSRYYEDVYTTTWDSRVAHAGSFWRCSWSAYIEDFTGEGLISYKAVHRNGGVVFAYSDDLTKEYREGYTLKRLTSGTNNVFAGFEIHFSDGSTDIFTNVVKSAVTGVGPEYALLSRSKDPQGRSTVYNWTMSTDSNDVLQTAQLMSVVDTEGGTNRLAYPSGGTAFTNIVDRFGRTNTFSYDSSGVLTNLVTAGMTNTVQYSGVAYGPGSLTTAYGTAAFAANSLTNTTSPNYGFTKQRDIRVLNPNGTSELWVYRDDAYTTQPDGNGVPYLPSVYTGVQVPTNSPIGSLDNDYMTTRNSFYWDAHHFAKLTTTNIINFSTNDFNWARRRRWLHQNKPQQEGTMQMQVSETLSLEIAAPLDPGVEGQYTWYDYDDKKDGSGHPTPLMEGKWKLPGVIMQIRPALGDDSLWYTWYQRETNGYPTNIITAYTTTAGTNWFRTNIYVYNGPDLIRSTNAAGVQEFSRVFDGNHNVTLETNAVWEVTANTYVNNLLATRTLPTGLVTEYFRDSNGWPTNICEKYLNGSTWVYLSTNSYTYEGGLVKTHRDPRSLWTTNTWDSLNRLTSTTYPDGSYISNVYSRLDLVASRDRLGYWTYQTYDSPGRRVAVTNPRGAVTQYQYGGCQCDEIITITNAVGDKTVFSYNLAGMQTNTLWPGSVQQKTYYDRMGRVASTTNSGGTTLTNIYNLQSLITTVRNAYGVYTATNYNVLDYMVSSGDANGIFVLNTFDALGRLRTRTMPDGAAESFGYTQTYANATFYTNQLGRVTKISFDRWNRQRYETNANNEITEFRYDVMGALTNRIDAKGQVTLYRFDQEGRMTNKVDHLGTDLFKFGYDANGRMTNRIDALGITTRYMYDSVGNLSSVVYPTRTTSFGYDLLDRMTSMNDPSGSSSFSYVNLRQSAEDGPFDQDTLGFSYDAGGRRNGISISAPNNSAWQTSYTYDKQARLATVTSPAGVFTYDYGTLTTNFVKKIYLPGNAYITNMYDVNGRLVTTILRNSIEVAQNLHTYAYNPANERTNQTRFDGSSIAYGYDNIGQLRSAVGKESGGAARAHEKIGYAYDAAGNLLYRTNNALIQTFAVNALNELTNVSRSGTLTVAGTASVAPTTLTVNGNAATVYQDFSFSYAGLTLANGNNTITAVGARPGQSSTASQIFDLPSSVNYQYDANGNLKSDGKRAFEYDEENQLASVLATNSWKAEFIYDGKLRRRIRRDYAWTGSAWKLTAEVRYVYDGKVVIQERDANSMPNVSYTRGRDLGGTFEAMGGIGGLLARTDNTSLAPTSAYYHCDGNGNITALIDESQRIVARYAYDPYGNLLYKYGPLADANVYRFSSKESDDRSGLIYYLYRFYDPNLQRWINRDREQERGGLNLFQFVRNSPIHTYDPDGQWPITAAQYRFWGEMLHMADQAIYFHGKDGAVNQGRAILLDMDLDRAFGGALLKNIGGSFPFGVVAVTGYGLGYVPHANSQSWGLAIVAGRLQAITAIGSAIVAPVLGPMATSTDILAASFVENASRGDTPMADLDAVLLGYSIALDMYDPSDLYAAFRNGDAGAMAAHLISYTATNAWDMIDELEDEF